MTHGESLSAGPGRRRDKALDGKILDAARSEIAVSGLADFSVRQVARRAGVSRKSIAARWPTVNDLLMAAIGAIDPIEFTPVGDTAADLTTLGHRFLDGLDAGVLDFQLRVTADAGRHPDAYALMLTHVLEPRSRALATVFRAGQDAGDVRSGDVTWLVRAFFGALLACTFQHPDRSAPTEDELAELIARILQWAAPPLDSTYIGR